MIFGRTTFAVLSTAAAVNALGQFHCANTPTKAEVDARQARFEVDRQAKKAPTASSEIPVVFHVIYSDETEEGGYVPDEQISGQIDRLNTDYSETGLTFTLANTTRTQDANWFDNAIPDSQEQTDMKNALRVGDAATLNLYSVAFTAYPGLLGYATFPEDYEGNPKDDGIVFLHTAIPGGAEQGYDKGRTVVHEAGHWVGLYHTFQDGCDGGDLVDDTPAEAEPHFECTVSDSCPNQPGDDPIHNYMDYTQDDCKNEFTAGQIARLQEEVATYRGIEI